jgi:hypothetical protein
MSYLFNGNYRPIICKYIEQVGSTHEYLISQDKRKNNIHNKIAYKILFADRSSQQKIKEFEEITKLFPGDYEYIARTSSARCKISM